MRAERHQAARVLRLSEAAQAPQRRDLERLVRRTHRGAQRLADALHDRLVRMARRELDGGLERPRGGRRILLLERIEEREHRVTPEPAQRLEQRAPRLALRGEGTDEGERVGVAREQEHEQRGARGVLVGLRRERQQPMARRGLELGEGRADARLELPRVGELRERARGDAAET